jgi:hypothetical protein
VADGVTRRAASSGRPPGPRSEGVR